MLLDRTEKVELKPEGYKDMSRSLQEEDDAEHRTLVTGVGQDHGQSSFLDRIFQDSEGVYLRASYPVAGLGRNSFAIVDGNGVATIRTRAAAETPAGTITVEDADANRLQTSFEVSGVDELRMPGISNYLGGDIRMSLMAGLDNYVVDQLISGLTAVDVTTGTTLTTAGLVAAVHEEVDGRAAQFFSDIRLLAGNTGAASQTTAFSRIGALMAAVTLDGTLGVDDSNPGLCAHGSSQRRGRQYHCRQDWPQPFPAYRSGMAAGQPKAGQRAAAVDRC